MKYYDARAAKRRVGIWVWAVPVLLAGLLLPFWPIMLVFSALDWLMRKLRSAILVATRRLPRLARTLGFSAVRTFSLVALIVMVLATGGLWLYSHISPEHFGSCHEIALYIGDKPTLRECQPYDPAEFAVPLALVAILAPLILYFAGEVERLEFPVFGRKWVVTRKGKEAAEELPAIPDVDQRGGEWLEAVPPRDG